MDDETYRTIQDGDRRVKTLVDALISRVEKLEERLNMEKKKVPSKVFGEKDINVNANTKYDKFIPKHPVTGDSTPKETEKIVTEKLVDRDKE